MRAAACIAVLIPALGFAQTVSQEATISTNAAIEAARGALEQCRADGQKVSVTVVDQGGRVKVTIRDDGAAPHTAEHSMRKAYTALSYRMTLADYGKRFQEAKGVAIGPQFLANTTTAAGGVPIKAGETTIGGIGISGTPSSGGGGEHDAKCAAAGIARIAKDLAR